MQIFLRNEKKRNDNEGKEMLKWMKKNFEFLQKLENA